MGTWMLSAVFKTCFMEWLDVFKKRENDSKAGYIKA